MEFKLNETAPGTFEIVRFLPEVVGTFSDRDMAEKVLGFLEADAMSAERIAQQSPAPPAPDHPSPKPDAAVPFRRSPSPVDQFDWRPEELAEAFARLEAGGAVKEVAEDYGKSWSTLRAKWAVHCKKNRPTGTALVPAAPGQKSPHEMVSAAVNELKEQDECKLCGRFFKPGPDNLEHCAGCLENI